MDVLARVGAPPQVPLPLIDRYLADAALRDRLQVNDRNTLRYISLNVAARPFDDVHVRRAVNLAINKSAFRDAAGGPVVGEIAGHLMVNSYQASLLSGYDPYATTSAAGDIELARAEMRLSAYDSDGDGRCDLPACRGVKALTFNVGWFPAAVPGVVSVLHDLGIELDLQALPPDDLFDLTSDPTSKVGMAIGISWVGGTPSASDFATLFSSSGLGPGATTNVSLVGATPEQLSSWGYDVAVVPSVDDRIAACRPILGDEQLRCWADFDRYLTEQVVPWVPLVFENFITIVGERVKGYSYDQVSTFPAFDRLAVPAGD